METHNQAGSSFGSRIRKRQRARKLWRDSAAPIAVSAGIASVELLMSSFPAVPELAPIVLVGVAMSGFLAGVRSAVLSSSIAIAYLLFFVADRHPISGSETAFWIETVLLACVCPPIAVMGGVLRQRSREAAETLQRHLTNTPLGVVELLDDYEVSVWAGSAETIFGIPAQEALGRSLFELPGVFFSATDALQVQSLLEGLATGDKTKAVHHMKSETKSRGLGHSRWFWSSVLDSRGKKPHFLVLVEDITDRVKAERELEKSKSEIIERLVRATELRDDQTGAHVSRMAQYCEALGRAAGLSEDECELLLHAAPMHDIGKIGIPDAILLKPGKLTEEEMEVIKSHTTIGAKVLEGSSFELVRLAETIALTHHENWDGTGYPRGLAGEAIPLSGRICAVCDVFDALTSDRPYKKAWEVLEAIAELQEMAGVRLDPTLVELFISILPEIIAIKQSFDGARIVVTNAA